MYSKKICVQSTDEGFVKECCDYASKYSEYRVCSFSRYVAEIHNWRKQGNSETTIRDFMRRRIWDDHQIMYYKPKPYPIDRKTA